MKHITFKSILYSVFGLLLFASCQNEPVEIQKQVEIVISPSEVLESFTPNYPEDLEMVSDEELGVAKLRITALIYDSNGELYSHNEGLLKDYNSDYSFNVLLNPNEEYKLLAFSSSIMGSLENVKLEAYTFKGINDLNTLEVTQNNEDSYYSTYSILGTLDKELNASMEKTKFELKAATAYVTLSWRDIHTKHESVSDSIFGTYSATAVDFYDNYYSWEITLAPGEQQTEVIINNLSPLLSSLGLTSEDGINTYSGYISGDKLIIPTGQDTGAVDNDIYTLYLLGINVDTFEEEDIVISIDKVNRTLKIDNMWGTYSDKNEGGFYELFYEGVIFNSLYNESYEYDDYYIIYHNNDIVKYRDNEFIYTTSLADIENNADYISPSYETESNHIYTVCNLLPGTIDVFARTFIGNESADYDRQSVTIKSGQQYLFRFYCADLKLYISNETKSTLSISGDYCRRNPVISRGSYVKHALRKKLNFTKLEY